MKTFNIIILLNLLFILIAPQTSHAGSFRFGTKQDIRMIQDIPLQGPQGEDLFLGHLVETHFFLLGTHIKDSGYVLGVTGNRDNYYSMPDATKIELAQSANMLPKPLPEYKLSEIDYAIGYSLWIAILVIGGWAGFKFMRQKKAA